MSDVLTERRVEVAPQVAFTLVMNGNSDDPVCSEFIAGHVYHSNLLNLMLQLVKPGDVVVDFGAHIGTFALTAAAAGCRVLAVEGNPDNAKLLKESAQRNAFDNLTVVEAVLADHDGEIDFSCKGPWSHVGKPLGDEILRRCKSVRADTLFAEHGIDKIDLLKLDVEGAEVLVLRTMHGWLETHNLPPVIYESNGHGLMFCGASQLELRAELQSLGYSTFLADGYTLVPQPADQLPVDPCVDCVAFATEVPRLEHWKVGEAATDQDLLRTLLKYGHTDSHFSFRAWVAHVLRDAAPWIVAHPHIVSMMLRLKGDQSRFVSKRAAWWDPWISRQAVLRVQGPHILHATSSRGFCGIGDYASNLVEELHDMGVANGIFPISVREQRWQTPQEIRHGFKTLADFAEGFDLVHIQHEFSFFGGKEGFPTSCKVFGSILGDLRRNKIPVVVTFHTEPELAPADHSKKARLKARLRKLLWQYYVARHFRGENGCHAIVHTKKSRFALFSTGFAADNIHLVGMGHPERKLKKIKITKEEAKRRLGYKPNSVLLSIFGFVASYKGHAWVAKALQYLPPNYNLAVVGGGHPDSEGDLALETVLQTWRRKNPDRLRITGYVEPELIDLYHTATDICLAPYLPVNLSASAAVTWALTSGKPVIASRIPAFREVNERLECMALVTPGAVHELAWQIKRVATDRDLQERLVKRANDYVTENSWKKISGDTARLYTKLSGSKIEASEIF